MISLVAALAQAGRLFPGRALSLPQEHPPTTVPDTLPEPPLPGGLAGVIRWFFHVPQWIQIGGAVLAVFVGGWLAYRLWSGRREIWSWIRTRRTALQLAMAGVAAAAVIAAGAFAKVSWDYTQHANEFCTACHVMGDAFRKFTQSEHADLECHDCHQQPISASMRQVYLWVLERPEEIGPHSPVPNERCAECHIQQDPDSTWQRIAATAGHRVHLESDSAALDTAMCVTCHGVEVHRFVPASQTCGQADCHAEEDTRIVLGRMAGQTGLHCVGCHEFTAPVSEQVPRDTAHQALVPTESQCLGCHEMQQVLADFQVEEDPHDGRCGWCHDPHAQETPAAAFATCTGSGCHSQPDTLSPFHQGIAHAVLEDCGACHEAHDWSAEGQDCASCHPDIPGARRVEGGLAPVTRGAHGTAGDRLRSYRASLRAGSPSDGAREGPSGPRARADGATPGDDWIAPGGDGSPPAGPRAISQLTPPQETRPDTLPYQRTDREFDHAEHTDVACTECHSSAERHGQVTVTTARQCASCHHGPSARERSCTACHAEGTLTGRIGVQRSIRLAVWDGPRSRELGFDHAAHGELECGECHVGAPLMPAARDCADCHEEHHEAHADCSACHAAPPEDAHDLDVHLTSCTGAGCHGTQDGRAYGPEYRRASRSFCLSCHTDQIDHEPRRPCAECHLLPEVHAGREGAP